MTQQIVGGAVLDSLVRPRRLLAARRSAPAAFAGMWEFPGGKVESGETDPEALVRELAEELGIAVTLGVEVKGPTGAGWPLNGSAAMRVWLAEVRSGEPAALQDHDELRWMELDDAPALLALKWIPADFPIVRALLAMVGPTAAAYPGRGPVWKTGPSTYGEEEI